MTIAIPRGPYQDRIARPQKRLDQQRNKQRIIAIKRASHDPLGKARRSFRQVEKDIQRDAQGRIQYSALVNNWCLKMGIQPTVIIAPTANKPHEWKAFISAYGIEVAAVAPKQKGAKREACKLWWERLRGVLL